MIDHRLSFSRRLWLSVMALFLVVTACFMVYQYRREMTYRTEVIDSRLQAYNAMIVKCLENQSMWPCDVRVTIIANDGKVVADNVDSTSQNHLDRPEVQQAIKHGKGRDISRKSATVGDEYFYSATYFPELKVVVRTALPYDNSLITLLRTDRDFVWLSTMLVIILAIIYEMYTQRLGRILDRKNRKMRSRLEQIEEEKERMKRQLTQNVAHELKTPVSSIQGFLDILVSDNDLTDEQRADFLNRCHSQATRLANILRDIGELTRLDEAPREFEKSECDLYDIINSVKTDLTEKLERQDDMLINNVSQPCLMQGNYSLLYSVFRNLVDNSIAYAGQHIVITIDAFEADGLLHITYADNGQGVDPSHLPYLFNRFYRVDKGRSRSMGGTGLGLAIVKHAVMLHGGHISALPTPGGGLQFEFTLKV